jgi:thermitase
MLTRNRCLLIVFLTLLTGLCSLAHADYIPGEIMVKFRPGIMEIPKGMRVAGVKAAAVKAVSVQALNAKHGVFRIRQLYKDALENRPDWTQLQDQYVLYFPREKDVRNVAKEYRKDPNIVSATPSSVFRAFDTTPNDTYFGSQYGLTNIQAPQAWDRTTGSSSVVIAVLDTGIDSDHEDFAGRIDARGKDYVNGDDDPEDDYGHGTDVSGVIGAATNNGKGVAGVDWQAKILPVKVLNNVGSGSLSDILDGIAYANSLSVEVINMSFGQYNDGANKYVEENPGEWPPGAGNGLKDFCQQAYDNNVVLVAAAGNGDVDWNTYPAYYPTVMAIAAVDQNDLRSVWSGIDPETFRQQKSNYASWIHVSAPGTSIWSTERGGGYGGNNNGTSLASPFVAGLAGLIKAASPSLTNQQVMDKIADTADDIDSLNPGYEGKLGSGRINAFLALAGALANISSPESGAYVKGSVDISGAASGWDFLSYVLEALKGGSLVTTIESSSTSVESFGLLGTWDTSGSDGLHTIRLRVFTTGANTQEAQVNVIVDNVTPEADITSPLDGQTVEGSIQILGTARDQYLDTYLLEYGAGGTPASYEMIRQSYVSVDGGVLGTWETSGLEGIYTVRLTVADNIGTTSTHSIQLNIRSTAPTKEASPQVGLPLTYALPNPFNRSDSSETTFNYSLLGNFDTRIYLFDLGGNLIWQRSYTAGANGGKSGENSVAWDGRDLFGQNVANGVYIYQVVADHKIIAKGKLVVLN